jgi:hypothetical protein
MLRLNIHQVTDLGKILPDVNINLWAGSFVEINIREVQNMVWNPTMETTVATHVDGVQLTRFNGLENHFFDLERVEVLKGPQGTLYGRGTTAGSMNIVTRKPVLGEFSGNVELETGNFNLFRGSGALNVPLGEKVAIRFAGRRIERDGYFDSGLNNANNYSARFSLRWEPIYGHTTTITIDGENGDEDLPAAMLHSIAYLDTFGDVEIVPWFDTDPSDGITEPVLPYQGGGPARFRGENAWALGNFADNFNENKTWGLSFQHDWEFDFATATILYGHRSVREHKSSVDCGAGLEIPAMWIDIELPPGSGNWMTVPMTIEDPLIGMGMAQATLVWVGAGNRGVFVDSHTRGSTDSYEIRLTSKSTIPAGDPLEWIIGGMWMDDDVTEYTTMQYIYHVNQSSRSRALFGQASWMPFDKWNLTAGYRYSWDDKTYNGYEFGRFSSEQSPFVFRDPALFEIYTYKYNEGTYKGNLSFMPTDDIMAYLQYSKGYKVGNIDFTGREIPPEFMDAWEFGFKSRWFNSRLQFNTSIYYYLYDNYNQWVFPWACLLDADEDHYCEDVDGDGRITPADRDSRTIGVAPGGSEQKGVSTNIVWLITPNDRLTLTGRWSHNEYEDYNIGRAILEQFPEADSPYTESGQMDQSGREFGGAPIDGNIGYMHTHHIGSDILTLTGYLFYHGEGLDQTLNFGLPNEYSMPGREDYWTGDVSASYISSYGMPPGTLWHLRFWCNNVWDNDALAYRFYGDQDFMFGQCFPPRSGTIMGGYIQPRTYGLAFGITW